MTTKIEWGPNNIRSGNANVNIFLFKDTVIPREDSSFQEIFVSEVLWRACKLFIFTQLNVTKSEHFEFELPQIVTNMNL